MLNPGNFLEMKEDLPQSTPGLGAMVVNPLRVLKQKSGQSYPFTTMTRSTKAGDAGKTIARPTISLGPLSKRRVDSASTTGFSHAAQCCL
jgi:hypothetical protein